MGELTRQLDWSTTSLGVPESWPQSLRTTLSILLNSRFPMFLFWGPELICFYNDAYRPSLGTEGKHPGALGKPGKLVWPEIWSIIYPLIEQVLSGGESTWHENQLVPIERNGHIENVYWTFSYSPVNDESGTPAGVFVTCTETTQTVLTHSQLMASNEQLAFAIDSTELGVWDLDPRTNRFTANARLKSWFGLAPEEAIPLPLATSVIAEKDRTRVLGAIEKAMQYESGGRYTIDYTIIHPKTNEERIVRAKGTAHFDDDRIVYRFNGTLQDITSSARSQQHLAESEQRFRSLIEEAPVASCLFLGRDMVVAIANETMLSYWGKGNSVLNKPLREGVPELVGQPFLDILDQVYETGETYQARESAAELNINGVKGTYYFDFTYKALRNAEGNVYAVMDTALDVTEKVMTRWALEQNEAKLQQRVVERTAELQRSNEDLQQFAHVASHDLREPLRKIRVFASRLRSEFMEDADLKAGAYLEKIDRAASRMNDMVEGVLRYSTMQIQDEKRIRLSLNKILEDIHDDLEVPIQQQHAHVYWNDLPEVEGSPVLLYQLFYNLINNSLKFAREGVDPEIFIYTDILDPQGQDGLPGWIIIRVKDNGIGFAQSNSEKIFDTFTRLNAKDKFEGTGLGLSLCRKIVERHGGMISAEGVEGQGSIITIKLPALQDT